MTLHRKSCQGYLANILKQIVDCTKTIIKVRMWSLIIDTTLSIKENLYRSHWIT